MCWTWEKMCLNVIYFNVKPWLAIICCWCLCVISVSSIKVLLFFIYFKMWEYKLSNALILLLTLFRDDRKEIFYFMCKIFSIVLYIYFRHVILQHTAASFNAFYLVTFHKCGQQKLTIWNSYLVLKRCLCIHCIHWIWRVFADCGLCGTPLSP